MHNKILCSGYAMSMSLKGSQVRGLVPAVANLSDGPLRRVHLILLSTSAIDTMTKINFGRKGLVSYCRL